MDFITILIILLALATIGLFVWCLAISRKLDNILKPRMRRANPMEAKQESPEEMRQLEDEAVKKRDLMNMLYSFAVNCTTIFPLLGMLGTVISLIGLAGNIDGADMPVDQFFMALRTTAAGIVGGILGKAFDAYVSVKVTANNKEIDTLLDRNSERVQQEKEAMV